MIEWKRLPSNAELLKFAGYLVDVHANHQPERNFVPDGDFVGALCERRFAWATGTDMDLRRLGGRGDGGRDNVANMKETPSGAALGNLDVRLRRAARGGEGEDDGGTHRVT